MPMKFKQFTIAPADRFLSNYTGNTQTNNSIKKAGSILTLPPNTLLSFQSGAPVTITASIPNMGSRIIMASITFRIIKPTVGKSPGHCIFTLMALYGAACFRSRVIGCRCQINGGNIPAPIGVVCVVVHRIKGNVSRTVDMFCLIVNGNDLIVPPVRILIDAPANPVLNSIVMTGAARDRIKTQVSNMQILISIPVNPVMAVTGAAVIIG